MTSQPRRVGRQRDIEEEDPASLVDVDAVMKSKLLELRYAR